MDCHMRAVLFENVEDIEHYLAKLDALQFEREIIELVISKIEEMA